jgi:hypothetical protein
VGRVFRVEGAGEREREKGVKGVKKIITKKLNPHLSNHNKQF